MRRFLPIVLALVGCEAPRIAQASAGAADAVHRAAERLTGALAPAAPDHPRASEPSAASAPFVFTCGAGDGCFEQGGVWDCCDLR